MTQPARPPPQVDSRTAAVRECRQDDRAPGRNGQRRPKVAFGRVAGNRRLRARGRRDRAEGDIKQHGAKIKNALRRRRPGRT
jgi:hypothetical protein